MEILNKLRTKIILIAIVGFLTLSIALTPALGWTRTFNLRPIDDWIFPNNSYGGARGYIAPDYEDNWYVIYFDTLAEGDYPYTGFVLEEILPDGALKYTVYIFARNVYMEVLNVEFPSFEIIDLVLMGTVSYFMILKFILEPWIPGGWTPWGVIAPGPRAAGGELPYLLMMNYFPEEIGCRLLSPNFQGQGSGELMEPGSYWDPDLQMYVPSPTPTGETASVFVHYQWTMDLSGYWPNIIEELIIS